MVYGPKTYSPIDSSKEEEIRVSKSFVSKLCSIPPFCEVLYRTEQSNC